MNEIDDESIEHCQAAAAKQMVACLVGHPASEYVGNRVRGVYSTDRPPKPTPEQVNAFKKSGAYYELSSLIKAAYEQQGRTGASNANDLAAQFFVASGMIYRLRVKAFESESYKKGKKRVSFDKVPAIFPDFIDLWKPPRITFGSRGEGADSMEGVSRDDLLRCAIEFYETGIRCPWFEKALLEALVCATLYASIKHAKTNPSVWSGRMDLGMRFIGTWAYSKSRGGDPMYALLVLVGRSALTVGKSVLLGGVLWWAYAAYTKDETLSHLLWLIGAGATVAGVVGRWIVQLIVGWARPRGHEVAIFMQENRFGRALTALSEVHQTITAPTMSTTVAREAALRSYEKGGGIDHIVVAYLDRAVAANEFVWTSWG